MSEQKNFDDYIRKEFGNYSPDVPSHIWDNIIAQRKKRRPFAFWINPLTNKVLLWVIGLIAAGSIGTGLYISHHSNNNSASQTNGVNNKLASSDNVNSPVLQPAASPGKTSPSSLLPVSKPNTNDYDKQGKNNITQPASPDLNKEITNSNAPVNNLNKERSLTGSGKLRTSVTVSSAVNNSEENNHIILPANKTHRAKKINDTGLNDNSINANTSQDKNDVVINIDNNKNIMVTNYSPNRLSLSAEKISIPLASAITLKQKTSPAITLPGCPTVENDAVNKKYVEIYISPDYAIRSITDTGNSAYLQKRKASTKFSSAFSAGIRYTKVFGSGVSIRLGLNYSQINETFSYVQGNVVQVTYTIDPVTGDTTGSYTVRGSRYKTTYNHYRSIDIPITIGYEMGSGKFHVNINAGVIANVYSWQKGDELDTNYIPVNITTGKGGPSLYQFRNNVGLGLTGGASFYYKLNDQLHLLAEPYLRYNFQPMSSDNLTLRQKYTTVGLRLGIRLDLPNTTGSRILK